MWLGLGTRLAHNQKDESICTKPYLVFLWLQKDVPYHFEWAGRNSVSCAIVIVSFHDKHEASIQQIFVYCEVCTLPPRINGLSTSK